MIFKSLFILCFFLLLPSTNLMANANVIDTIDDFYNELNHNLKEYHKEAETKSQPKLGGYLIQAFQMLGNIKEGILVMKKKVIKFLEHKSTGTFIIIEKGLKDALNVLKTMIHILQEKEINGEIEKKPAQLLEASERLKAPQKEESGMDLRISQKIDDEAAMAKKRLYFIEKLIKMCKISIQYLNIIYEELQTVQRDQGEHSADGIFLICVVADLEN